MADVIHNKVDMSLDDIIKISKSEKRKEARLAKQQNFNVPLSKGRGYNTGRGNARGQLRGRGRGRGNSVQQNVNKLKQFRSNLRGFKRGRGRGRGMFLVDTTENPLNRLNKNQLGLHSRGRGRSRANLSNFQSTPLIFTNSQLKQTLQQKQRLNETKQQALLLRKKQLALKNLQQAKQNFESINLALQKTSRDYVVNQMRGLNTQLATAATSLRGMVRGRGRDRGRGRGRGNMMLSPTSEIDQNNISTSVRQLNNTSVTVINSTPLKSELIRGGKRRRWRGGKRNTEHFTIQVANQSLQPVKETVSLADQLKLLKPAVSTSYKFQKSVFAAPATGVSLNERFSGPSLSSSIEDDIEMVDGRKVFI